MLVGVDVGGTNLRVGVIEQQRVIDELRVNADFSGLCRSRPPDEALAAITQILADAVGAVLQRYPDTRAVGLGFPGFVEPNTGRVIQSPNLPGLRDVDLAGPLQARLTLPVLVENDALAAAYGEYCLGGWQQDGLIYLGLGTGVGGGLITHGNPYPGEHGVAMEVGHIIVTPGGRPCGCGNAGCMEQYASASGVSHSYFEASGQKLSAYQIAQRAEQGDAAAGAAFALAGVALAQALAHILKVVDVGRVVIGGGMSGAWPLISASFERQLQQDLIPALRGKVHVILSTAGDQAGMAGAALLAARLLSQR